PVTMNDPFGLAPTRPNVNYYICCYNGKTSVCKGTVPIGDECLRKCALEHEAIHMEYFRQPCHQKPCQGLEDLSRIPGTIAEQYETECEAWTYTWDCIKKCKDSEEKVGFTLAAYANVSLFCGHPPK